MGCGKTIFPNGTELYSSSCQNRQNFISWDGIHCSETANMLVANRILDGSISNPPLPTQRACKLTENVVWSCIGWEMDQLEQKRQQIDVSKLFSIKKIYNIFKKPTKLNHI
ncbi:hypothetical protein YC2023_025325 [Brassica napus]